MHGIEIFLIAIALSMDAFAVALAKGLSMNKIHYARSCIIALFFGIFQLIMPIIGWLLSSYLQDYSIITEATMPWFLFLVFSFLGTKMLYEACKRKSTVSKQEEIFSLRELFFLAIGTSLDALAVGITFALFSVNEILFSAMLIGCATFSLSFLGVVLGNKYGILYGAKAECVGACILLSIACKALFTI